MRSFIAVWKDTGQKVMVITVQPNGWAIIADEATGDIRFTKTLKGYKFIKWA